MPHLGIHYFADTLHYRQEDLRLWLPVLKSLRLPWLILHTSARASIPESFIKTLLENQIQPTVHFQPGIATPPSIQEFGLLFKLYAQWGIKHVVLFDRPNLRQSWPTAEWVRANPVERFLDIFIPRAEAALQAGLSPVFPPLQPGGDYWDTVFLRSALAGLVTRGHTALADRLTLAAYALDHLDEPTWGQGGPECWPTSRPYHAPSGSQDQRGFHVATWYLAAAEAALGFRPSLIMLQVNAPTFISQQAALPPEVLACGFWLLAAEARDTWAAQAWFSSRGEPQPGALFLHHWLNTTAAQAVANLA
jgi:hypothetical protein